MSADLNLRWEEPPPTKPTVADVNQQIADALRERAGEWALILEGATHQNMVYRIRNGSAVAYQPAGSFEAIHRRAEGGGFNIYARYVGANVADIRGIARDSA